MIQNKCTQNMLLGLDIGTSSIKASVIDPQTQQVVASAQYPDTESPIASPQAGWAEQDPEMWWQHTQQAIAKIQQSNSVSLKDIQAVGIAYQMHGLVMVNAQQEVLRPAIIWCDSRAVPYGQRAFERIGAEKSLSHLLNSLGNFTAAKLAWVKENQPEVYEQCHKIMLPGDYIAMKLTGQITTSNSALSEGIFWDFQSNTLSPDVMNAFGFSTDLIPEIRPVFSNHGEVRADIAQNLGLRAGIPITYKAGDQPNNALSLNVLEPGEVAATAGTSGVVYAVSDKVSYDPLSRVNTFAHVNHQYGGETRLGILLCINGTGIMNAWAKRTAGTGLSYTDMNTLAAQVAIGANGLRILPFGNGAERVLQNRQIGASIHGLDLNVHGQGHIFRAVQEGIAFSLKYGIDLMAANGTAPTVIRAGKANLFLSHVFAETLVNATQTPVELYDTDGAKGAALGAGIGVGIYQNPKEAFLYLKKLGIIEPNTSLSRVYEDIYQHWHEILNTVVL